MFTTYVLYSEAFDRIYIGQTSNLTNRLEEHNAGLTKSTKHYIPWKLIYSEKFVTRKEAMKREKELKSHQDREFIRNQILKQ